MIRYQPPPYSPAIQSKLAFAAKSLDLILDNTPDRTGIGEKARISAALSAVAIAHFHAIFRLVSDHISVNSAFSLLRPLAETIVRAEWLVHCASETEYHTAVHRDKPCFPTTFPGLAIKVDEFRKKGAEHALMNGDLFGKLSGYTHSGMEQVNLHLSADDNVELTVSDEELGLLIDIATAITLRHFFYFCMDSGTPTQAAVFLDALASQRSLQQ